MLKAREAQQRERRIKLSQDIEQLQGEISILQATSQQWTADGRVQEVQELSMTIQDKHQPDANPITNPNPIESLFE